MAIDFDIDRTTNIVLVRIYDVINIQDISKALENVQKDTNTLPGMAALIDAREIRRAFFVREMDALIQVLAGPSAAFLHEYAFVVTPDVAMDVGKKFLLKARRAGLKLEVFRDHASALSWFNRQRRANA